MNAYLRNISIAIIANIVVFLIGWGCIVPDQLLDQTHLFGLVGDIEIVKGNTATVFGICACMSTLIMIISLVEAIVEDYSRPRFCSSVRSERPRKSPKPQVSGMRIADSACPEKCTDEDPKTPTMD